jgi:transposase
MNLARNLGRHLVSVLAAVNKTSAQGRHAINAGINIAAIEHRIEYNSGMLLRYNYRLYPTLRQRTALARAFGCARVVFNDGLRARQDAHTAGQPYITDAELSARLTAVKATPERAWLGEVSAVVLQQALADLNAAYRNFLASITGTRKGPKVGPPCNANNGPKPLYIRTWQCQECGTCLDRDTNAAVNVAKAAGLAVSACGAQVRPGLALAQRGEAGTLRGAA